MNFLTTKRKVDERVGAEIHRRYRRTQIEMKSSIIQKTKFPTNCSMLGGVAAGLLAAIPALAGSVYVNVNNKVAHVLLISVDGMHQSDLAWYAQNFPKSTLASLLAQGVDYSNASTPYPSDSFPGMLGQLTGGNP